MAFGDNAVPKKYTAGLPNNATWTDITGAITAGKTLIVSKLIAAYYGASTATIRLMVRADTASATGVITWEKTLGVGEEFTETGVVIPAGERLYAMCSASAVLVVTVFGEEVDN